MPWPLSLHAMKTLRGLDTNTSCSRRSPQSSTGQTNCAWHQPSWLASPRKVTLQTNKRLCRRIRSKPAQALGDYVPSATDPSILQKPLRSELDPEELYDCFGYQRDLRRKFEVGKVIGAGSFGVVRRAVSRVDGRMYACKSIPKVPKRGKSTPRYLLKIQNEVDAMRQIGASLDAVYLKDVFEDNSSVHLVMELCEGGGILERVRSGRYTEASISTIIRSILRFIAQCHAKGLLYRDVKPDNFLFLTKDADSPVRATDFGLSIRYWAGEPRLSARTGTPVFMAPELIQRSYATEADLWSVGMLMYHLLTGHYPFWDSVRDLTLQQVWGAILGCDVDLTSEAARAQMSEGARDLLKGLLKKDPSERLTATEALEHPWVREGGSAPALPLGGSVVQRLQRYATYGHLKQVVLRLISDGGGAWESAGGDVPHIGPTLQTLKELFREMDRDNAGHITEAQLASELQKQGYAVTPGEVSKLVARIDANQDGTIDFDEFAVSLLDWNRIQQESDWEGWVHRAFDRLDANGDGFLSLEELLQQLPAGPEDDDLQSERLLEARRMLREADANNDGRISREEFTQLLAEASVPDSLDQYDNRLRPMSTLPAPGTPPPQPQQHPLQAARERMQGREAIAEKVAEKVQGGAS